MTVARQLVSEALSREVQKKVGETGLVVWLDADSQYTAFVDGLGERDFRYPVLGYRGSYLELMLALEPYGSGDLPEKVLVHLPGFTKDSVRESPVYELYKAGTSFEKNLGTLVREAAVGAARPEDVEAFVRSPELSLAKADAWLASQGDRPVDQVSQMLEHLGIDIVALELVTVHHRVAVHLPTQEDKVFAYLERTLGLTPAWRTYVLRDAELQPHHASTLVASWLMAVEYVHDLRTEPRTPELRALLKLGPFAKECRRLSAKLRDQHPDLYEACANDLQDLLVAERSQDAEQLGAIDTFRFEEQSIRDRALADLLAGRWEAAARFADARTTDACFWVRRSPTLQRTWELIRHAAQAGRTLDATKSGLDGCQSLDEALDRYTDKLAAADRHHRLFEQRAHAQMGSDLEDYDALLGVRDAVRRAYRTWADDLARAFHKLCVKHGPLPSAKLRQRGIYREEVHPLVEAGTSIAYVMVDALRFEMGQALAEQFSSERFRVTLKARLSELPSLTAVGMNVLAPVEAAGKLTPVVREKGIAGFSAGAFAVEQPHDRVRAISKLSLGGATAVDLEVKDIQSMTLAALRKKVANKPLLVVRSRELDDAGEVALHLSAFEQILTHLKSVLSLLAQAGVERFVVVSDHGFLLQDPSAESVPLGATARVADRRHALLSAPAGAPDCLEVQLSRLDYTVASPAEDAYLLFRPDTACWKAGGAQPFVHGGNSLQERVVPVLILEREGARGKTLSKYEVVARAEPAHLGRQRLRVAVRLQSNTQLGFLAPKQISLALRLHRDPSAEGEPEVLLTLLDVQPPATLGEGRILCPPNQDEALVEFELTGALDGKARVEIYHPDGREEVTSKVVEGFFDVARFRKAEPKDSKAPPPAPPPTVSQRWEDQIEDEAFRKALKIVEDQRSINEDELVTVLGSPRRVRAFAHQFDTLVRLLPFEVEIITVQGMKAYKRRD